MNSRHLGCFIVILVLCALAQAAVKDCACEGCKATDSNNKCIECLSGYVLVT